MTALLSRRDDRCLSDLTMDRYLLGETSDSDEGRMLQRHLAWCASCLARVQSLRTLYSHADMPEPTLDPAPVPEALPAARAEVAAVMEIILLRDGLLVGTEVFTPGTWVIGTSPLAQLKLQGQGLAAEHARLVFRAGRVVVERRQGPVLVNGFRVERSEVRPIDELIVGPFVLRARVIGRSAEPEQLDEVTSTEVVTVPGELAATRNVRAFAPPPARGVELSAPARAAPASAPVRSTDAPEFSATSRASTPVGSTAASRPSAPVLALRLDLFWGDALQGTSLVRGEARRDDFPAFSPGREGSATRVNEGWRLALPGARLEVLRAGRWQAAGDECVLAAGETLRARDGALRLEARLEAAPELVAPTPRRDLVRGPFVPLTSFLMLALLVFAGVASRFDAEEDGLAERPLPRISVMLQPKPPTPKIERATTPTDPTPAPTQPPPTRRPPPAGPPPRQTPPHLTGLGGMTKVLDVASKISKQLAHSLPTAPGKSPSTGGLVASLGQLGANQNGHSSGLGLNANDSLGIGRSGLKNAGQLKTGNIGRRKVVAMSVDRTRVTTPPTAIYDRNAIAKVIEEHLAEISRCYEGALLSQPNLSGNLSFEWVIGTSGTVTGIKLKGGSLAGSPVAPCVSSSIKQWRFPAPKGGPVTVSYPFGFRSTGF